jgi:hypothetical protein
VKPRALLIWCVVIGCGPKPAASSHAAVARTDDAWAKLTFEQRHSAMTFTVLPNMAHTWRDFEKTQYPEMTCRTCHGKDAEVVSYRMPNPALPPIDPVHPPQGPIAQFMIDKVVPEMIDLTETTPNHFGCNSCHPNVRR